MAAPASAQGWSANRFMRLGLVTAVLLVFCLGAWAAFASISGAVVAQGRLKVSGERQVVQHLTGGVVAEIAVREGDFVRAGDLLIRLDDRRLRAEFAILEAQLHETMARIARLEAEQMQAETVTMPEALLAAAARDAEVAGLVEGQLRLFEARRALLEGEREQLRERQVQIGEEIRGLEAQADSTARQLEIVEKEFADLSSLLERGLTQASRVMALDRERQRLVGEQGALVAAIAQARGRIAEIGLQRNSLDGNRIEEAMTQLRDLKSTEVDLRERRLDLVETIERLELRAPRDGVVLDMRVFALSAVVQAADPVVYVVPTDDDLVIDTRIRPQDIDQVWPGQPARLRFAAFNQRTTPEVPATVVRVSPDALQDATTGETYYLIELAMDAAALELLDGLTLMAGMPVDAFIQTGARSPLAYLVQPMTDFLARSWREN